MSSGLFWAYGYSRQAARASGKAASAKSKASRVEAKLNDMEKQVEHLSLACQALWELLRDNTDFTEEDIRDQMQKIDLRDGKADGKMSQQPLKCPACGRMSNSSRSTCMYCGAQLRKQHFFE